MESEAAVEKRSATMTNSGNTRPDKKGVNDAGNAQGQSGRIEKSIAEDRKTVSPPTNTLRPNPFLPDSSPTGTKPVTTSPNPSPAPVQAPASGSQGQSKDS